MNIAALGKNDAARGYVQQVHDLAMDITNGGNSANDLTALEALPDMNSSDPMLQGLLSDVNYEKHNLINSGYMVGATAQTVESNMQNYLNNYNYWQ